MKTKKIAIVGFGVEGRAVYDYLKDEGEIFIFDENPVSLDGIKAEFIQSLNIPEEIDVVYKSPGVPTSKLKIESTRTELRALMNDVLERVGKRAIGVTGTKGKSTVTSLIHHILKESGKGAVLFGNIGIADMEIVNSSKDEVFVIELSSYQCEHLKVSPHVAVLLDIYPEHLTHHGSYEKYQEAKLNIARYQNKDDFFVNASGIETDFDGKVIIQSSREKFETKLKGEHNQKNCSVATSVVELFGINEETAREHIKSFNPLKYRLENIGEYKGINFYDDSLASIPQATIASIEALHRVDTIILGGENRNVPLDDFAKYLANTGISNFIVFPETGNEMVKEIKDKNVFEVSNMEEAVRFAFENTEKGGVVLLSNAAKTSSIFKDYKDKSEQYSKWIKELGK